WNRSLKFGRVLRLVVAKAPASPRARDARCGPCRTSTRPGTASACARPTYPARVLAERCPDRLQGRPGEVSQVRDRFEIHGWEEPAARWHLRRVVGPFPPAPTSSKSKGAAVASGLTPCRRRSGRKTLRSASGYERTVTISPGFLCLILSG